MTNATILPVVWFEHEILMHAPLVLFLICPLLILLGAILPPLRGWPYRLAALLALSLGTVSLFFFVQLPALDEHAIAKDPAIDAVQWICRSIMIEARIIFTGLTAIYVGVILLPEILRRRDKRLFSTVLPFSFLVLYSAGAVFLLQATNSAADVTGKLGVDAAAAGGADATQSRPAAP